jgi:cyanate permease
VFNIGISFFSLFFTALTFHVVSIFKTAGHSRGDAVSVFLPASVIAIVSSLFFGWLSDRPFFKYRLKYLLLVMIAGMGCAALGIMLLQYQAARYLVIVGNGVANGVFGTLLAVPWARYFGRQHLGAINGFNQACLALASAIGPLLFGISYHVTGAYVAAALGSVVFLCVLAIHAVWANRPVCSRAGP